MKKILHFPADEQVKMVRRVIHILGTKRLRKYITVEYLLEHFEVGRNWSVKDQETYLNYLISVVGLQDASSNIHIQHDIAVVLPEDSKRLKFLAKHWRKNRPK